jgi:hypothetical protein
MTFITFRKAIFSKMEGKPILLLESRIVVVQILSYALMCSMILEKQIIPFMGKI